MTQDHSSKLSFSIEESVWLNKGQEVDEIVSLSLDPDITVEESGDYVLIRGGLRLTGEYRSNGNSNSTEEFTSLSDQVGFRSIEEVTVNEDGTGEIKHHFPIDVTIPQERINSLDDIYVVVESFDYDLPERGCIQLTADVTITGMSTGNIEAQRSAPLEQVAEPEEQEDRSFHFEAYSEADAELKESTENNQIYGELLGRAGLEGREVSDDQKQAEELIQQENRGVSIDQVQSNYHQTEPVSLDQSEGRADFVAVSAEPTFTNLSEASNEQARAEYEQNSQEIEVEASEEIENTKNVMEVPEVKIPLVAFGVIKDRPKQEKTVKVETETEQPKQIKDPSYAKLKGLAGNRAEAEQQEHHRHQPSQEYQEDIQKQTQRCEYKRTNDRRAEVGVIEVPLQEEDTEVNSAKEENALYLTKMLTKGEEEFKKLKMCIIQEDETLEIIASRYEINQSALIRVNRLNGSNVEVGQILYIPAR